VAIHQLLHTLSYGDAISGEVFALRRSLQEFGVETCIFALNVNHKYREGKYIGQVEEIKQVPSRDGNDANLGLVTPARIKAGDTIILHYSLGSPLNNYFCSVEGVKRVILYHNITPSKWYAPVNSRVARDIEAGIADLPMVCHTADLVLADSEFNQCELLKFNLTAKVLELPLDPERWDVAANPGIAELMARSNVRNVLHVGRIAPNKCIEDVIKSFYFYHHYIDKNSRLWIVGIDIDTELYSFALKRLVYDCGLDDVVTFTGAVADEELRSFYEGADVYLCMSEHEGFCLPVIEALHYELPVIAYNAGALPKTLGGSAILVDEKKFAHIAELMNEVIGNESLRNSLISAGKERVAKLSYSNFKERVKELLING
jgi:glycosyltransferase involved in cell wall biosynthesis